MKPVYVVLQAGQVVKILNADLEFNMGETGTSEVRLVLPLSSTSRQAGGMLCEAARAIASHSKHVPTSSLALSVGGKKGERNRRPDSVCITSH